MFAPGSAIYDLLAGQFGVLTMTPVDPARRHSAAGDRLLPAAFAARRHRLPAENRRAHRPLPDVAGAQRARGHPADPGAGLRDDGDADDAHPRQQARALHRDGADGGGGAVLGATGDRRGADGDGQRPIYTAAYFAILLVVFVALGTVLNRLVPGQSTDLLIDLPSLRLPRIDNVARKTGTKVWAFMTEVTMFFVGGTLFLGVLQVSGGWRGSSTSRSRSCTGGSACRRRQRRRS